MKEFKGIVFSQAAPSNPDVVWVESTTSGVKIHFYLDGIWHSLANVATTGAYTDLSGTPTIPMVPEISTDIVTDKTSDTKTASPKSVYSLTRPTVLGYTVEETVVPAGEEDGGDTIVETIILPDMLSNVKYSFGTLTEGTFVLETTGIDQNIENIWHWTFDTDTNDELGTFTMPNVIWAGGSAPVIAADKYYDIKVVLDNGEYYATYTQISL